MKKPTFLLLLAIFVLIGVPVAQGVDLDAPAKKKITVRSEIKRGADALSDIPSIAWDLDILRYLKALERPIEKNIQDNTDSDGFLLGAYMAAWSHLNITLEVIKGKIPAEEYKMAEKDAKTYFKKYRELQKKLKIDDRTLIVDVLNWRYEGIKPNIDKWASR